MKKLLTFILLGVMLLLTACGGGDVTTTTTTTPTPVEQFVPTLVQHTPLKPQENGDYRATIYSEGGLMGGGKIPEMPLDPEINPEIEDYSNSPTTIPLLRVGKLSFYQSLYQSKTTVLDLYEKHRFYNPEKGVVIFKYSNSNSFELEDSDGLQVFQGETVSESALYAEAERYIANTVDVTLSEYQRSITSKRFNGHEEDGFHMLPQGDYGRYTVEYRRYINSLPTAECVKVVFNATGDAVRFYYYDYGIDWSLCDIDAEKIAQQYEACKALVNDYDLVDEIVEMQVWEEPHLIAWLDGQIAVSAMIMFYGTAGESEIAIGDAWRIILY